MAFVIAPSISYTAEMRSADVIGMRHERASNWGLDGLIAGGILLSSVLAFLMALVVDTVIGFLNDGSVPELLVLVAAGAIVRPVPKAADAPARSRLRLDVRPRA
jgi:hypothetical protein